MAIFTSYIWSNTTDGKYVKTSTIYGKYIPGNYLEYISRTKSYSVTGTSAPLVYYFDNSNQRKNIRINASSDSTIVFNSTVLADKLVLFSDDFKISKVILDGTLNTSADVSLYLSKIDLVGNTANNTLVGNSLDNKIDGGKGNDTLTGLSGNDTYTIDSVADIVIEKPNDGTDTVIVDIKLDSYTLPDNVENVAATALYVKKLIGNSLNNVIDGTYSSTLDGGLGEDILIGTTEISNTYIVDNVKDTITETGNKNSNAIDFVESSVDWTLGEYLENLTLIGSLNLNGTGNSLDNKIIGNSGNNVLDGKQGSDIMIGGSGNDTYVVDNVSDSVTENINEGIDTIQSSITWTLGSNLENLTLTSTIAANATGNDLSNVLKGNAAANALDGGSGNDTLIGGAGDDIYVVDSTGDTITEFSNEGTDTVQSSINWILGNNIENLTLIGTNSINGTGNSSSNVIRGNSSNNILDGNAGSDTLIGGIGDDTYIVDSIGDVITESANQGTDTVKSSITWKLSSNLENLTLIGTNSVNGTGNELNNILVGNSFNNILDGSIGSDTMIGGAGDDVYYVDDLTDVVLEYENEGDDTVISDINFYLNLTNLYEIENVTVSGTQNLNATGNYKSNVLTGNSGNNILDGGVIFDYSGPSSFDENDNYIYSDVLVGGNGDDTYYVQSNSDTVIELANEGTDTVFSNSGYTLPSNVENLTLTSYFSDQSSDYYAIGNDLNNVIVGNEYNNIIQGKNGNDTIIGNGGNDILDGGLGKDTFVFGIGSASITRNTYTVGGRTYNNPVFDKIIGFEIGTDTLDVYGNGIRKPTNIGKLNVANNLFSYDNVMFALNSKFTKDGVFVFTYGQRTFLGVDDGILGYNKDKDCVIEITGYTGNLSNLTVI